MSFVKCRSNALVIILISCSVCASDLIIMKHTYGRRGIVNSKYEPATIDPLYDHRPDYLYSDFENIRVKKENHVSLNLKVREEKGSLLATVNVKNNDRRSLFVPGHLFTSSTMQFFITTDNIKLGYLGAHYDYGENFGRDDWVEIAPGETIFLTQVLNDNYEFLPGKRIYEIGSTEYTFVNEKWFVIDDIKNAFASITTPDKNTCYKEEGVPYVFDALTLCDWRYRHHPETLINVLSRFGYDDDNNKNSFEVRTDPAMVKVNGSRLTSLYDKEPFALRNN